MAKIRGRDVREGHMEIMMDLYVHCAAKKPIEFQFQNAVW